MSEDTKRRIIAATRETLRTKGAAGTSAREIAKAGDFNTSLLFYHFGSVEGALMAAARTDVSERVADYRDRLRDVEDLQGLVDFSRDMHAENASEGHVTVLVQMLAATQAHPDIREELAGLFDPWIELVGDTLDRLLGPDGLPGVATSKDLAVGVTSLFLGLELLTSVGDDVGRAPQLLDALSSAADVVGALGSLLQGGSSVDVAATGALPRSAGTDQLAGLPGGSPTQAGPAGTPPPGATPRRA